MLRYRRYRINLFARLYFGVVSGYGANKTTAMVPAGEATSRQGSTMGNRSTP